MIVFCHLLNDASGSPRVLSSAIEALAARDGRDRLYVGSGGRGGLQGARVEVRRYWYRRSRWRLVTLFTYLTSQVLLYRRLSRERDIPRHAIVYVNTLLPFAAALWGRRTGRRVIYHLHEVSVTPGLLRRILTGIAQRTADRLIYVSNDHRARLPIPLVPAITLANPIDRALYARGTATDYAPRRSGQFEVLMLASPRDFKGVPEFLELARSLVARPDIHFRLVLNADAGEIADYVGSRRAPANVTVHPRSDNPAGFYAAADLVMNLSRPDLWIETFGLTLVEAMAFGVPVIAPPQGGPGEIVRNGVDGFLVDPRDRVALANTVIRLADNPTLCTTLSISARDRARNYSWERFAKRLRGEMRALRPAE